MSPELTQQLQVIISSHIFNEELKKSGKVVSSSAKAVAEFIDEHSNNIQIKQLESLIEFIKAKRELWSKSQHESMTSMVFAYQTILEEIDERLTVLKTR